MAKVFRPGTRVAASVRTWELLVLVVKGMDEGGNGEKLTLRDSSVVHMEAVKRRSGCISFTRAGAASRPGDMVNFEITRR